jgi:hypothetical protein
MLVTLRAKGLSDKEIEDAIARQVAAQIQYAYKAGLRDGEASTYNTVNRTLLSIIELAKQPDLELAS